MRSRGDGKSGQTGARDRYSSIPCTACWFSAFEGFVNLEPTTAATYGAERVRLTAGPAARRGSGASLRLRRVSDRWSGSRVAVVDPAGPRSRRRAITLSYYRGRGRRGPAWWERTAYVQRSYGLRLRRRPGVQRYMKGRATRTTTVRRPCTRTRSKTPITGSSSVTYLSPSAHAL